GRTKQDYLVVWSTDSLATSRDRIKGRERLLRGSFGPSLLHPLVSPAGTIFHDPIQQCLFKADVGSSLLALDPFVFQDFLALGQELFVENRVLHELRLFPLGGGHLGIAFHIGPIWSTKTISSRLRCSSGRTYSIGPQFGGTCFCTSLTS